MNVALIASGISGSGKNHLVSKLKTYFNDDFECVEPDDIRRIMFGDVSCQKDGHKVFEKARTLLHSSTKDIVFFNATNTRWAKLKDYIKSVQFTNRNIIFIFMMDSKDKQLCKNRVARDIHMGYDRSKVPEFIIDSQYESWLKCVNDANNDDDATIYLYSDEDFPKLVALIEENLDDD